MADNALLTRRIGYLLITSQLTFLVFLVQYVFRYVDNNRLTSWKWTFGSFDLTWVLVVFIFGIITAYLLSRFTFPERNPKLFLFFASFIAGVSFWNVPEVIVDASRYFTQAKHLEIYGIKYFIREWGGDISVWTDLPLIPFLYGLIFKFLGESRIYIQVLNTTFFSMVVVLTFMTGRILWDENVGFFGGLLLLGMPYLLTQVPLMLVDIPSMFFLAFALYAFIKALNRGGIWIFVSSLALFLAFFSKYSTWLMLSILAVTFLVYLIQGTEKGEQTTGGRKYIFFRGLLVAFIAGIFIGALFWYRFDLFTEQISFLLEYQKPGLKRWGESFISTFFFQVHPFISIAALYSIYLACKKRDIRFLIIFWLILLVFALQIKRARYIFVIFPMLALMASYGMQKISNNEIRRFIAYCAVVSSLAVAVFVYNPFLQKMSPVNLKNAGRFLDYVGAADVEVFTVYPEKPVMNTAVTVPILDIFTAKKLRYSYDPGYTPPFSIIKESPVRFTWEFKNPDYYSSVPKDPEVDSVLVVIWERADMRLPKSMLEKLKGYRRTGVFRDSTGIFLYSPMVMIYQQDLRTH